MSDLGDVIYLYIGSADVGRDLRFYLEGLGGEQVWRFQAMGAEVAGVRLSGLGPVEVPDGPVLVLTDPSGNQVALLDQVRPNVLGGRQ